MRDLKVDGSPPRSAHPRRTAQYHYGAVRRTTRSPCRQNVQLLLGCGPERRMDWTSSALMGCEALVPMVSGMTELLLHLFGLDTKVRTLPRAPKFACPTALQSAANLLQGLHVNFIRDAAYPLRNMPTNGT